MLRVACGCRICKVKMITEEFTYGTDGQVATASFPQQPDWGLVYDRDSLGRLSGVRLVSDLDNPTSTLEHQVTYGFDNTGRLSAVSVGVFTNTYQYGPDGASVAGLSVAQGAATRMGVERTYDGFGRLVSETT